MSEIPEFNGYVSADFCLEEVELLKREHHARLEFDRYADHIKSICRLSEYEDPSRNQMIRELVVSVYGINHPEKHVIRYPENWIEALKERFAPSWLRNRWPVKFITVTASLEESYPDFVPALPDYQPVTKVAVAKRRETYAW